MSGKKYLMQTLGISGMGVVGLKDRQVEMVRGLGGCSPCREAVQVGAGRECAELVLDDWSEPGRVEIEAGRDF